MPKGLNFQQIQAFKATMETGTTTKAAAVLHTTQPSVSRRLADLQATAGLRLFEHSNGRLRPTREGRQLYQSVLKHFDGLEKIETAVAILRKSGAGVLHVGATPTLAASLLPPIIAQFMTLYPGTFIGLQSFPTPQLEDRLRRELIDVAITTGMMDETVIDVTSMMTSRAVCIMPINHPAAQEPWITLDTLRRYRVILLNDADNIMVRLRELLGPDKLFDDIAVETNSSITICSLVSAGVGVGVVNPFVADNFADQLLIKKLEPAVEFDLKVARSPTLAPSLLSDRFLDLLRTVINAMTPP